MTLPEGAMVAHADPRPPLQGRREESQVARAAGRADKAAHRHPLALSPREALPGQLLRAPLDQLDCLCLADALGKVEVQPAGSVSEAQQREPPLQDAPQD